MGSGYSAYPQSWVDDYCIRAISHALSGNGVCALYPGEFHSAISKSHYYCTVCFWCGFHVAWDLLLYHWKTSGLRLCKTHHPPRCYTLKCQPLFLQHPRCGTVKTTAHTVQKYDQDTRPSYGSVGMVG